MATSRAMSSDAAKTEPAGGVPSKVGRYRLLQLLARGGMGEVFVARQDGPAGFAKTVVLKRILPNYSSDTSFVQMFLNEARLAALLNHPNVCQIFELGEADGTYFIAMEYVHGQSLRKLITGTEPQSGPLSPVLSARIASLALQGLHHAHTLTDVTGAPLGIVHRDVSPDNILIGFNGQVKVLDFGVAKMTAAASTTNPGSVKGKLPYMSPEQIRSLPLDARSDCYAMGIVLYEAVARRRPFQSDSEVGLLYTILNSPVPSLRAEFPSVPRAYDDIVQRALSKDPAARFSSAEEMAAALDAFIRAESPDSDASLTSTSRQLVAHLRAVFGQAATTDPNLPAVLAAVPPEIPEVAPEEVELVTRYEGEHPPPRSRTSSVLAFAATFVLALATAWGGAWFWDSRAGKHGDSVSAPVASIQTQAPAAPRPSASAVPTSPAASVVRMPAVTAEPAQAIAPPVKIEVAPATQPTASMKPSAPRRKKVRVPGRLHLFVHPWAEVFWKEKSLGITPLAPFSLPAGKQTLTLKNPDLGTERVVAVTIRADEQSTLRVNLLTSP